MGSLLDSLRVQNPIIPIVLDLERPRYQKRQTSRKTLIAADSFITTTREIGIGIPLFRCRADREAAMPDETGIPVSNGRRHIVAQIDPMQLDALISWVLQ